MRVQRCTDRSKQHPPQVARLFGCFGACMLAVLLIGCAGGRGRGEALTAPRTLTTPYNTINGEVLWAVVPLRNESGTSQVDSLVLSDHLIGAIEETQGLRCLPLDRTLAAMQALKLQRVRTPAEARTLAQTLGADGIVVGTISAYDPYTPMIGLSLALYARPGAAGMAQGQVTAFDPNELKRSTTDETQVANVWGDRPLAVWSDRLDAKNHQVLMDVRTFGEGRSSDRSALGWKRYTASADLFAQFAMYRGVDGLLQQEWTRVAKAQMPRIEERREVQ
ncbi:MAG: hypothetical protein U0640_07100 [Phycisphaerales bacterium]